MWQDAAFGTAVVMIRVKIGCELSYTAPGPTPGVFILQPPPHARQRLIREELNVAGGTPTGGYQDLFGNRCQRMTLAAGSNAIRYDALALVSDEADVQNPAARAVPPAELPSPFLRFTLPSRYAETDQLIGFAWETFAKVPAGWPRARAICDWVRENVRYRRGVSGPHWSAADALNRREGVCRDRAHAVIALCRAFNMPARYAVSYLPDLDVEDDGTPMDFHAYAEVWLEGGWYVFDPHDARARRGRVFIAAGLDAADAAFATFYGGVHLTGFRVWAEAEGSASSELGRLTSPSPPAPAAPARAAAPASATLAPWASS